MIRGFHHKGLKLLFERDDRRKLPADHTDKIARVLARLEEASAAGDMDLPGFRLHRLKGDLAGFWSVTVSSNWRVIFRFEGGHASDVDLVDHH